MCFRMNTKNYYRVPLYKAFKVAILSYLYEEPLLHSFMVAFSFRKVCNEAFDVGVTPEQIEEMMRRCFPDDDYYSLN